MCFREPGSRRRQSQCWKHTSTLSPEDLRLVSDNCEIITGVFALVESSVLVDSNLVTFLLTIWVSGSNRAHNPTESVALGSCGRFYFVTPQTALFGSELTRVASVVILA